MVSAILWRTQRAVVTLLVLLTVVFVAVRLVPGDPALTLLGDYATPELVADVQRELGLDRPIWSQYVTYLGDLFTGDLGYSYRNNMPAMELIASHFPYTAYLAIFGFTLGVIPGILAGTLAGQWHGTRRDLGIMGVATLAMSVPPFWLGLVLLFLFSLVLPWFPLTGGGDSGNPLDMLYHLVLPAIAVGARQLAIVSRVTRSSVLDVWGKDYLVTAEAKGLPKRQILRKHVLRNAMLPVISISALEMISLLSGTMVVEVVFSRPGLGSLFIAAVNARDLPLIQACVIVFGLIVILVNFIADLLYGSADPRVRGAVQ